jgi:hypothetical protein
MKNQFMATFALTLLILLLPICSFGQGTFLYDQQSSDESNFGAAGIGIQSDQPAGQSFTPLLSSVGFIRLSVGDGTANNSIGGTLVVYLRANSITGTILGTSAPVVLVDNFGRGSNGVVNFFFWSPVTVSPGTTYFFQPAILSGDDFGVAYYNTFNYPGGTGFFQGTPSGTFDMWFREGIVVPEPSTPVLAGIGCAVLLLSRKKNCKK